MPKNLVKKTDKQFDNRKNNPFLFKKGQSGNPAGRPKGKSLKEFARQFLENLSEEDKIKYLNALPPEIVWRMSEGNPAQDVTSKGEKINPTPIYNGLSSGDKKI